jgi:D-cysteine desulfhydrase family pyridoxal phosphate-dependent enzyme
MASNDMRGTGLKLDLPRLRLAQVPTPLQPARRLAAALGCAALYVKRDDLTGLGLGGNKARKLELLLADALHQQADVIITTGGPQSNHARITAAAARALGLECVLVLSGVSDEPVQGNLLLDHLFGATVHLAGTAPGAVERAIEETAQELRRAGRRPYVIPVGGSTPLGAAAYALAMLELLYQMAEQGISAARLYCALGSGGTMAGLVAGAALFGGAVEVVGISVSRLREHIAATVAQLATETTALLGRPHTFAPAELAIDDGYIGPGYGALTAEAREAIWLVAREEGLVLDPVYTAKAMAGLIGHLRTGRLRRDESVIFLHSGGIPALFSYAAELMCD